MQFKKTVTIGIPAHNGADNIAALLDSILSQDTSSYTLKQILIACDGCTDNTAEVVRNYIFEKQANFIQLINDSKRIGKCQRLNQFYQKNRSDILITFDDDLRLVNKLVIENIVKAFADKTIGLVGGNDIPFPAKTFFENIVATSDKIWYETRKDINGGDSVHNHIGRCTALSLELTQKLAIPNDINCDDEYLYFRILQLGYKFKYAKDAIVYYFVPEDLKDFFVQQTRFLRFKDQIEDHFGSWVKKFYEVPTILKIKATARLFFKEPFLLPLALGLQILVRLMQSNYQEKNNGGIWTRINVSRG